MSYDEKTYKNADKKEESSYKIVTKGGLPTSSNDIFRMMYPGDLLIELSGMGGNPIGPYGDIKGNYTNLMNSNIDAFAEYIQNYDVIQNLSKAAYNAFKYIIQEHKETADVEDKEKVITFAYEVAETMMKEALTYIRGGKEKELIRGEDGKLHTTEKTKDTRGLTELLKNGFFVKDYGEEHEI